MTPKGERIMSDAGKTRRIERARAGYSRAATSCSK
jgi:hypothetical protein